MLHFRVDATVKVTDFNSGKSFNVTRTGGTNLATVETPTSEDYNTYITCFGGSPNWEKRAMLVTIGDKVYAASMFGNPNGEDKISDNTMAGHTNSVLLWQHVGRNPGSKTKRIMIWCLRQPERIPKRLKFLGRLMQCAPFNLADK